MLKETANNTSSQENKVFPGLDFDPEYQHPTPGEFPLVGYLLSNDGKFSLQVNPEDVKVEDSVKPSVPSEPENPDELDDRQNVLNLAAMGCNLTFNAIDPDSESDTPDEPRNLAPMLRFLKNKLGTVVYCSGLMGNDQQFEQQISAFISTETNRSDQYKNVVAFRLTDEPSKDTLEEGTITGTTKSNPLIHCYTRLANKIRQTEGLEGMILINMMPIHGAKYADAYQNLLNAFQAHYKPQMYSVDVYPVLQWNPVVMKTASFSSVRKMNAGEIYQVHERFYRTLGMISAQARKNDRPFWYYPLCGEHFNPDSFYYPAQKEEYLRYSVFTALAYGAKAIVFWRTLENTGSKDNLFLQQGEQGYSVESYLRHPINADRTRSPFWYYTRRIIREIKRYKDVFLNTEVRGVYHTGLRELGDYADTRNTKGFEDGFRYVIHGFEPGVEDLPVPEKPTAEVWGLKPLKVNSLPVINSVVSLEKGLGVLVSHLVEKTTPASQALSGTGASGITISTFEPNEYYMIVNHDAANAQRVRVKFNPGYKVRVITPYQSGVETSGTVIDTTLDMNFDHTLNPGGYLIFQLEVKKPA